MIPCIIKMLYFFLLSYCHRFSIIYLILREIAPSSKNFLIDYVEGFQFFQETNKNCTTELALAHLVDQHSYEYFQRMNTCRNYSYKCFFRIRESSFHVILFSCIGYVNNLPYRIENTSSVHKCE